MQSERGREGVGVGAGKGEEAGVGTGAEVGVGLGAGAAAGVEDGAGAAQRPSQAGSCCWLRAELRSRQEWRGEESSRG